MSPRQSTYLDTLHWVQTVQGLDDRPTSASDEADIVSQLAAWSGQLEDALSNEGSTRALELYQRLRRSFQHDRRLPRELVIEIAGVLADDFDDPNR